MAQAQSTYPDRIRWFTSLPWEYPARAIDELDRTCRNGASGVMVLANISGRSLTDPMFDTTLAITRMIFEGFFDQYPHLKIIA